MNALLYAIYLALGRHFARINDEDRRSVAHDWRSFPGAWDDYRPPYPTAYTPIPEWELRWEAEHDAALGLTP